MRLSQDMKNSADLGGCYPPLLTTLVDNTLLDLQNSSFPTQPYSTIAKYLKNREYYVWKPVWLYTVVKANVYTNSTEDTYQGYAYSF